MPEIPRVPWQITGNHWVTVPCIHPADATVHAVGALHAASRGAVEFAGGDDFLDGGAPPLARITVELNGERRTIGSEGIAWERESGWIPTFSCRMGPLALRGTICAPHDKENDLAGVVIAVAIENRGERPADVRIGLEGTLGLRQVRVRNARRFTDPHVVRGDAGASVILEGQGASSPMAIAIGGEGDFDVGLMEASSSWSLNRRASLGAGETHHALFHVAIGAEGDGAAAMLRVMRRRGGEAMVADTRKTLREMEPATGNRNADRLIARHVFFCYFGSLARAIDESHWYVVRSRIPWNDRGMTIRDWESLMWVMPAVQLVNEPLAREILLRTCELHGYAPGAGVHYLDGSVFEPGFSLEGAASFAIATDAYIVTSSDDRIVDEPVLAETLYGCHDDIHARRHPQYPLYSTEVNPDGSVPAHPYTAHGNAAAALALDILKHTLDEKSSERIEDPAAVRAALIRHFGGGQSKAALRSSIDLAGQSATPDNPSASLYWLPHFDLMQREDSVFRRTVKPLELGEPQELEVRCARLLGPSGDAAFDWLRRAPLDGGFAAERVDEEGKATAGGGDAALSGLIAHTLWFAVHALGVKAG